MGTTRKTAPKGKPVADAVHEAVGALSELLRTLKVHAREVAADAKVSARDLKAKAETAGRNAKQSGRLTLAKAEAAGSRLLADTAKGWHQLTESSQAATAKPAKRQPPKRRV